MDYVISYLQSESLLEFEDEDMSQLMLNDFICKINETCTPVDVPVYE